MTDDANALPPENASNTPAESLADSAPATMPEPVPASLLDVKADTPAASPLVRRLDAARQDLLELSTRNRLLNTPRRRKRSRALEIVEEQSDAVFHLLVEKGNALSFVPAPEKDEQEPEPVETPAEAEVKSESEVEALPEVEEGSAGAIFREPEDDPAPEEAEPSEDTADDEAEDGEASEIDPARLTDRKLQTLLNAEDLQKRLLRTFYDARSSHQEQGVNTLFLALGFLKWFEDERPDKARHAPLLLVPVHLERKNARTRFSLTYDDSEITTNLSLQAKLKAEFGLDLPDVPELDDEFKPSTYIDQVRQLVEGIEGWEVLGDDIVLSFFSFSKFLMYRDLDPENWQDEKELAEHPLLEQLLGDSGFQDHEPVVPGDVMLDEVIGPKEMIHVVPADTSQAIAVEGVRQGRNMVVQGPPGTGKSQTIANLIAAAVKEGKKVLFVAEKMAALEVVKRRLTNVGIGDMCLELHSHKARKRAVLDDLEHTLALGGPKHQSTEAYFEKLASTRDTLNEHAQALHQAIGESEVTPYHAIGELVQLRAAGVSPADFTLDNPAAWTAAQAESARQTLGEFVEQVESIGTPGEHPWRGVSIDSILPMDLQRLVEKLPSAAASLRGAQTKARALADALEDDAQITAGHTQTLAGRARRLAAVPMLDREAIKNDVWAQQAIALSELFEHGLNLTAVRKQLDGKVNDAGWSADLTQTRLDLASFGKSLLRWLNPAYKRAKRQMAAVLTGPPPKPLEERLKLVDQLLEAQKTLKAIERDDAIGRYAFGTMWRGEASDWDALGKLHGWNRRNDEQGDAERCRELVAKIDDVSPLTGLADEADDAVASAGRAFEAATGPVQLDLNEAFGVEQVSDVPLGLAAQRIEAWVEQPDGLTRWISVRDRRASAQALGMAQLVEQLNDGERAPADAAHAFDMAYYEALLRHTFEAHPELARFTGESHEHTLEQFRKLDGDRLALARHEVATAHHDGLPRGGGEVGQVGLLRREFQKKRRHLPLRRLLREAGLAIQAIKPVFMMSPMSVAQYLEPGGLEFDLMLMDEASQVRPVDALGAVSRCQQIVVVGDDKQLPPTRFFDAMTSGGEEDDLDDTELDTSDLESILGLCTAQNMPSAMLRWHYRSQHPSLIAVSNREFYESNLFVIPSPRRDPEELGLRFHKITEGHFDRGGTATHRVEAQTIAEAVIRHATETPELTLGVGAFSVRQRDAILDEIEHLRRKNKEVEGFFVEGTEEPFFVKNLENIQGDERDVIFISVGYGPDEEGNLTMNFGPLSNDGGERRLNVLITRAKKRLEVFSSMTADDIDLSRVSKRGPAAFRTFLRYAQTGTFDGRAPERSDELSVFEQSVTDALAEAGHAVEAHVGEAGFYVDLAVVDPETPGRYLLGITLDGPGYGACRSARERDSSREFILKMRGWAIHRLWSIDWFNRPHEQLQKILDAVETARAGQAESGSKPANSRPVIEREVVDPEQETDRFAGIPSGPYVEASFKKLPRKDLEDLDNFQLIELVTKVVEIEEPVHGEEVMRRAADIYKVDRMTSKVTRLLESALADAVNAGKLENGLGFYSLPGVSTVSQVRSRADVESPGLRKPEFLPPAEVRFALESVARVAIGVSKEDAVIESSRLLGFASTRSNLREVIERELEALLGRGVLEEREGAVFIAGA